MSTCAAQISTEKRELERMLKTFNIFIDNPCCVLTQEESKKFIGGHERDKYDFFLKVCFKHIDIFLLCYSARFISPHMLLNRPPGYSALKTS